MPATKMAARPAIRRPLDISELKSGLERASAGTGNPASAETVRDSIRRVGNSSNLILDTDLDSFSLVDLLIVVIPRAQERLADIEDTALHIAEPSENTALELSIAAGQIEESDLGRATYDIRTAVGENNTFKTVSPSLQAELPRALHDYTEAQEHLIYLLKQYRQNAILGNLEEAFARARTSNAQLWNVGSAELEKLLSERLHIYETYRFWGFIFIALSFLSSSAVAAFAGRSIAARVRAERAMRTRK